MKVNIENSLTYLDYEGNPITEPMEGQIATCANKEGAFRYVNGQWEKISVGMNMTVYDMNKQIIAQLPTLTEEEIEKNKEIITQYANDSKNKYYMLLCREENYYTIFDTNSNDINIAKFCDEVVACAQDWGNIKSISLNENGDAIEIWVNKDTEAVMMYLFAYDLGVIECRK